LLSFGINFDIKMITGSRGITYSSILGSKKGMVLLCGRLAKR
jgi:hypothetical protein